MKVLDYIGLTRLIEKIKLYFLDKDTYNSYAEYQVVPSGGIQLSAGASVLYVLSGQNDGITIQREVFLTSMNTNYSVLLFSGHVESFNPKYQYINNYFVEGPQDNTISILWKKEKFYNV